MIIEKHGRLIDIDKLADDICAISPPSNPMDCPKLAEAIIKLINNAPTVVPKDVPIEILDKKDQAF